MLIYYSYRMQYKSMLLLSLIFLAFPRESAVVVTAHVFSNIFSHKNMLQLLRQQKVREGQLHFGKTGIIRLIIIIGRLHGLLRF